MKKKRKEKKTREAPKKNTSHSGPTLYAHHYLNISGHNIHLSSCLPSTHHRLIHYIYTFLSIYIYLTIYTILIYTTNITTLYLLKEGYEERVKKDIRLSLSFYSSISLFLSISRSLTLVVVVCVVLPLSVVEQGGWHPHSGRTRRPGR